MTSVEGAFFYFSLKATLCHTAVFLKDPPVVLGVTATLLGYIQIIVGSNPDMTAEIRNCFISKQSSLSPWT